MLGRRARAFVAAASLLWLAPLAAASAQETSDPIIVTGRTPEQAEQFVQRLAIAPGEVDQLARWDQTICTSVVGLPARQGQFIADRVAQRAYAVGLSPGEPGCHANVAIFVTADSDATAQRLFEQDRSLFAYYSENNVSTLGQAALEQFLHSQRAVRWWHVAQTIGADGNPLSGDAAAGGVSNAPVARSTGTRLRSETRQDFSRAIIVVDARRAGSVQLSALADYIAMVALAQIDPNADTSAFPTVLNLFAGASPNSSVAGLTDWDTAYLSGLYSATRNAANVQQQENEIAARMLSGGPRSAS